MPASTTRKARKPVYEPILKLPPLAYEDFVALRDNIAVHGVLVPILVDSPGPRRKIIDGNYRKAIADELDPMAGSGTMLLAGLDHGASKVIGIEKVAKYLRVARRRIGEG